MNWTDSRDDSEWEIEAVPLMGQVDPGEAVPMIGQTPYTLWFSAPDGASHRLIVDPDVGSRLSEFLDEELATYLDEARQPVGG
jgi:hypothetical protein